MAGTVHHHPKMTFRLLNYNLRGVTTLLKHIKVFHFLNGLDHLLDVVCGQEHKLRFDYVGSLQSLWPTALFITTLAKDGHRARRNPMVVEAWWCLLSYWAKMEIAHYSIRCCSFRESHLGPFGSSKPWEN